MVSVSILGCGSSYYAEYTRSEYQRISQITGNQNVVVGVVPNSRGAAADAITAGLQEGLIEASLSRSMRKTFKTAQTMGHPVFVTGNSRAKSEWALESALKFAEENELSGLKIYFEQPIQEKIKIAAKHAGVRIVGIQKYLFL